MLLGSIEICINGVYYPVCGQANASLDADQLVALSCRQLGYYGERERDTIIESNKYPL